MGFSAWGNSWWQDIMLSCYCVTICQFPHHLWRRGFSKAFSSVCWMAESFVFSQLVVFLSASFSVFLKSADPLISQEAKPTLPRYHLQSFPSLQEFLKDPHFHFHPYLNLTFTFTFILLLLWNHTDHDCWFQICGSHNWDLKKTLMDNFFVAKLLVEFDFSF